MKARRRIRRWTTMAAVAGAAAGLGAVGCDNSCEGVYRCPFPVPVCPEDPAEAASGDIPAECGVWVSATLGDDKNDGSQEAPVATLAAALAAALQGPQRVYACAESFDQPLVWPAGVALHGGFSCAGFDWVYLGGAYRTGVSAPADQIPLTLAGSGKPEPALLTDLFVEAADAVKPGGSSIAVLALPDARAGLRRTTLSAGNGAAGAAGDDGDHFGQPAKDGLLGNNGAPACTAPLGLGGNAVVLDCEEDASFGGQGGDAAEQAANPGDDGEVAPAMNPQGFGLGGVGEDLFAGLFCTPGLGGAAGTDGESSLGGFWPPRLTPAGYVGTDGGNGERGRAGQGGGGGGASAGNVVCGAAPHGGAGGGAGGSGGCGGKGGRGGQAGGASIGLAMLSGEVRLMDVLITAGIGGDGGHGGVPQQGGQGGLPGIGGAGLLAAGGPNPGCAGGAGGWGGDGGHAGGGLGGPSLGVAYVGAVVPSVDGASNITVKAGGIGGMGSDPNVLSARGQDGAAAVLIALLP